MEGRSIPSLRQQYVARRSDGARGAGTRRRTHLAHVVGIGGDSVHREADRYDDRCGGGDFVRQGAPRRDEERLRVGRRGRRRRRVPGRAAGVVRARGDDLQRGAVDDIVFLIH